MTTPATKAFDIVKSDGYATLKLNGSLDSELIKQIEAAAQTALFTEPYCNVVINCENLSELTPQSVRMLMNIQRKLKSTNRLMRLVSASPAITRYLLDQGVNDALPVKTSLRAALVDFGLVTQKSLDVNFINPFLTATMNVLKIQASTESKAGVPYKRDSREKFLGDITGIIGLITEAFRGSVVISFPEKTFLKIISRMLGEEFTTLSAEIQDGAGELTNIIFGQAKVILNEKGYGIQTAIPSVVMGKDHNVQNITNGPRMTIPFQTDVGDFFIEICVSQ